MIFPLWDVQTHGWGLRKGSLSPSVVGLRGKVSVAGLHVPKDIESHTMQPSLCTFGEPEGPCQEHEGWI